MTDRGRICTLRCGYIRNGRHDLDIILQDANKPIGPISDLPEQLQIGQCAANLAGCKLAIVVGVAPHFVWRQSTAVHRLNALKRDIHLNELMGDVSKPRRIGGEVDHEHWNHRLLPNNSGAADTLAAQGCSTAELRTNLLVVAEPPTQGPTHDIGR